MGTVIQIYECLRKFVSHYHRFSKQKPGTEIQTILEEHGCDLVDFVKRLPPHPQVCKIARNRQFFALKVFRSHGIEPNGVIAHRDVLPRIPNTHKRLVIPKTIACGATDAGNHFVIMTWEKGHNFNDRWSLTGAKTRGGKSIQIYTVQLVLELIEDLYNICTESFGNVQLRPHWQECSQARIYKLLIIADERRLISSKEQLCSQLILDQIPFSNEQNQRKMLSNGDFQFRNFIEKSANKSAVIDWDEAKFSSYELEHCVAYQWMLMWNNPSWQRVFLSEAKQRFSMDKYRFRSLLLFNCLRQAIRSGSYRPELAKIFIDTFRKTLKDRNYNSIWD